MHLQNEITEDTSRFYSWEDSMERSIDQEEYYMRVHIILVDIYTYIILLCNYVHKVKYLINDT